MLKNKYKNKVDHLREVISAFNTCVSRKFLMSFTRSSEIWRSETL